MINLMRLQPTVLSAEGLSAPLPTVIQVPGTADCSPPLPNDHQPDSQCPGVLQCFPNQHTVLLLEHALS